MEQQFRDRIYFLEKSLDTMTNDCFKVIEKMKFFEKNNKVLVQERDKLKTRIIKVLSRKNNPKQN